VWETFTANKRSMSAVTGKVVYFTMKVIPIPIQQSSEHRLLKAQKHTMNSLAKCISAVFTIDDVTVCEEPSLGAEHLYNLTVSSTQSSDGSDLPSFPLLQKEYSKKMRMQEKARRSVMKYKMHKQGSQTCSKPKRYCFVMSHSVSA